MLYPFFIDKIKGNKWTFWKSFRIELRKYSEPSEKCFRFELLETFQFRTTCGIITLSLPAISAILVFFLVPVVLHCSCLLNLLSFRLINENVREPYMTENLRKLKKIYLYPNFPLKDGEKWNFLKFSVIFVNFRFSYIY